MRTLLLEHAAVLLSNHFKRHIGYENTNLVKKKATIFSAMDFARE